MKKILIILLACFLILPVVSCSGSVQTSADPTGENSQNTDARGAVNGYLFEANGTKIAADALIAPILQALGEPKQYYESASCAFNGLDKVNVYDHFQIDSYPSPDGDRVMAVYLMDDLVTTPEGLRLGDTAEKTKEIYGAAYRTSGTEWIYEKGGMELHVLFENDLVSYITYASKVLGQVAN